MGPQTLDRIPDAAERIGVGDVLSQEVESFLRDGIVPRAYSSALRTIVSILRCSTIRDLCTAEVQQLVENRFAPYVAQQICGFLWIWVSSRPSAKSGAKAELDDHYPEEDTDDLDDDDGDYDLTFGSKVEPAMSRRPEEPLADPVPQKAADIIAWAQRNGIEEGLDERLPEWVLPYSIGWEVRAALVVTSRQVLTPSADFILPGPARSQYTRRQVTAELLQSVRQYLERFAEYAQAFRKRQAERAEHASPPTDVLEADLARVLLEARGRLGDLPARSRGSYLPDRVVVVPDPPTLVYEEKLALHGPSSYLGAPKQNVTVHLSSWQAGLVTFTCHICRATKACPHIASALDEIQGLLFDPRVGLHERLGQVLRVPGWSRFLDHLDRSLTPVARANPDEERLIWNLLRSESGLAIYPVIQKRTKRGAFSRGQRITGQELLTLRDRTTLATDRAALDVVLGDEGYFNYASLTPPSREVFQVLSILAGSSNVYAGAQRVQPLSINHARIHLAFEERGGTYWPQLRVGPLAQSAAEIVAALAGGRYLMLHEEDGNRCVLAEVQPETRHLLAALARYPLTLPVEALDELAQRLQGMQGNIEIEVPESVRGARVEPDSRVVVRLQPMPEEGLRVELGVRPIEDGPTFAPGEGSIEVLWAKDGKRVHTQRALEPERERAHAVVRAAGIGEEWAHGAWCWNVGDDGAALEIVRALQDQGDAVVVEWPEARFRLHGVGRGELRVRITQRRDWFGVEGEAGLDEGSVSLEHLLAAVRAGRRFVKLGAHRFALIEDSLRSKLQALDDVVFSGKDGLDLGLLAAPALADLVENQAQLDAVPAFHATLARLANGERHEPVLPTGLSAELRHYQIDGYKWLARLAQWGLGACLADDMGLGKTLQALALLLERQALGPALVIAPTSVVSNWGDEARKFAPGLSLHLYRGSDRASLLSGLHAGDVLVTSYAIAVRDAEPLKGQRFATLIIDEAQSVKNATTLRFRAVRELAADFRVALTGTPVENHLGELWAIFRLVAPGLLGPWERFREKFALPIERDRNPQRQAALARVVRPFLLRRTKREVAPELPPRTEMNHLVELSPGERLIYEAARTEALESLGRREDKGPGDEAKRRIIVLAALTKLRLLACHPRLVIKEAVTKSAKLTALGEILAELKDEGHRALVFSQFTSFLDLVEPRLRELGFAVLRLDGSTPAETRGERVAAFQSGLADVFLISLRAGGTGLNLTAASFVVHLDPWWNPAVEDQATDRAHRIGQDKAVTVIRLVSAGTVEEKVLAMHAEKRELAAAVLEGTAMAGRLDTNDLVDLMRAREGDEPDQAEAEDEG
jgi:superfamily II DNA or RNA helicase